MKMNKTAGTQEQAILWAIEDVGTKTSLQTLQQAATKYYRYKMKHQLIPYSKCSTVRSKYRKSNGDYTKNTTYQGQPRRNQGNDNAIDFSQIQRLHQFFSDTVTPESFLALIQTPTPFHSLAQVQNAVEGYQQLTERITVRKAA